MLRTFANAWKDKDIRGKLLFTIMILVVYRIGACITVPFVAADYINMQMSLSDGIFGFINILSGGAFAQATLFALGVSPYITASIVIQLLAVAIPALERLSKEGEEGRKKMEQITRVATVLLALITSIGYYFVLKTSGVLTHTGKDDCHTQVIEFKLTLDSNPEFTGSVLTTFGRAVYRMAQRGEHGCKTVFDIAPVDLSPVSREELIAHLL